ncbi:hypothetical protein [Allokutzneria multivorans]|uniref:hypothetical protein n=1 Tax=Allokutzneria multivorans TaxID=1142134 RepID=UPI0031EB5955
MGEVREILLQLASITQEKIGEAESLRTGAEAAHQELVLVWDGSRHEAAYTAQASCASAVDDVRDGVSRLHRAAEVLTSAAHRM